MFCIEGEKIGRVYIPENPLEIRKQRNEMVELLNQARGLVEQYSPSNEAQEDWRKSWLDSTERLMKEVKNPIVGF